ncbi:MULTISPECIES: LrgB family protein [Chromobacterium]|uniref:LrgB family protein n=1 Tax=Chromobacterium TaxID=535 RepID=UPI000653172C|nr:MULTISPECIES: LrgB family protein [Chromobacterium]KMN76765.1 LrgB [Chromobacterium sp. LK11]MCS3805017.1 putative effector of murein hydrolase [Chromobacterium alkanivorans]MCS3819420.1 putative effector of murein hydrolase [Chromobacterium alkanivorans]MCS3873932.1 putative effector of murein hydrolase [Chromobacterium alkanivorans]PTU63944.1 murein hydrolase effector protein LrgB [Chromobacterium sp. Panama]
MEHEIALASLLITVVLYGLVKKFYLKKRNWWSAPILAVPLLVIALVVLAKVPYRVYFEDTRWLTWMLGPATVAFAVPIYEHRAMIRRHWLSLSCGVLVGMPVAVFSSIWLARLLGLSELLQRSLAPRSISTPFALATASGIGASPDLTAVFVVMTGVCGMLLGEVMLAWMPLRSSLARGALFGAAAHAAGTAKASELGAEEGVVASLTMMLGGLATVFAAPLIGLLL